MNRGNWPQGQGVASGVMRSASQRSDSSSSGRFQCPNCSKSFARGTSAVQRDTALTNAEDLLRRHQAREARAMANPSFDRQKSCYACARSKARCDLGVPSCGRCRERGKQCVCTRLRYKQEADVAGVRSTHGQPQCVESTGAGDPWCAPVAFGAPSEPRRDTVHDVDAAAARAGAR